MLTQVKEKKKRLWEDDECAWRQPTAACGRWTTPVGFQVSLNLMRHLKFQLKTKNKVWHHGNPMHSGGKTIKARQQNQSCLKKKKKREIMFC